MSDERQIQRQSHLPRRTFVRQYLNQLKPIIITDAVGHWPALSKWTPQRFRERWGAKEVGLKDGTHLTIEELFERISSARSGASAPYLWGYRIQQNFAELLPDINPPMLYAFPDRLRSTLMLRDYRHRGGMLELLIGAAGGGFPMLHYDVLHLHAFITQIYGDKEFVLYSPDQSRYLYPGGSHSPNISRIPNAFEPDLERYPLFVHAKPIRGVVRAGETVFVPAGWWHTTRMLTDSIAVSLNTVSSSNWRIFSRDICAISRPLKRPIKSVLLATVGAILSRVERGRA